MKKQTGNEGVFGLIIAGIAILLIWLLNRKGLLHETVSAGIVTNAGTVMSDTVTGAPQYDSRIPATVPESEAFAIEPITPQGATSTPADPRLASCPIGYRLWRNAADGRYWCLPTS